MGRGYSPVLPFARTSPTEPDPPPNNYMLGGGAGPPPTSNYMLGGGNIYVHDKYIASCSNPPSVCRAVTCMT